MTELVYIVIFLTKYLCLASIQFQLGTKNRKEQLKKAPYTLIKQSNNIQNENISDKYIKNVFLARHDH